MKNKSIKFVQRWDYSLKRKYSTARTNSAYYWCVFSLLKGTERIGGLKDCSVCVFTVTARMGRQKSYTVALI